MGDDDDQPRKSLKRILLDDGDVSNPLNPLWVNLGVPDLIPNYRPISWHCRVESCGDFFRGNKDSLAEHHRLKHKLEQYQCLLEGCSKTSGVKADLMAHIRDKHSNVGAGGWKCCNCSDPFDTYQELKCHHKLYHEEGEFGCVVNGCRYETNLLFTMDTHYQIEHNEAKKELVCTFKGCATVCTHEKTLWQHVIEEHLQKNPFKCVFGDGQCDFRHADLDSARAHVKAAHLKGRKKSNATEEILDKDIRLVTKTGKLVQRTFE